MVDPKTIQRNEVPPPVVVEQVVADDEVMFGDGVRSQTSEARSLKPDNSIANQRVPITKYRLAAGRARVLEVRYTANSFVAPERVLFKYRLDGYDKGWRLDDNNRRVAFYTGLRPGSYVFHVKACNNHGYWPFYLLCAFSMIGMALAAHAYRIRLQHRVLKLEEQRTLANERTRIARDLHDDLGASLTGIALQLEAAQKRGGAEGEQLATLASEARAVAHDLRELAWTTNPRCDNAVSLVAFVSEVTERFCKSAGLGCRLELPETDGASTVPARVRHELLMVLKESLANIGKHSAARNVTVSLAMNNGDLRLAIKDDGRGFDSTVAAAGSGLRNLKDRLQQAGGSFMVQSHPGAGTTFAASLPRDRNDHVVADPAGREKI